MSTGRIDTERSEAFAEELTRGLNGAATTLMVSIGHRTGLFDALSDAGPLTSEALAERAALQERYVREWLGAMTAARIVLLDPDSETYLLPTEHAAWLTRAASPNNIAVTAQWIAVLGQVEDDIVRSFREGGGVPYERFRRFHETMAEESDQTTLAGLFDHILPLVPELVERLEDGIRVADLGCGRGKAILALAGRFPNSTFLGLDLGNDAVEWARTRAAELGLDNVTFDVRDLTTYDRDAEPESFDLVLTFDAVHDQAAPLALLQGIRRSLRPQGVYLMQDIDGHSHHHGNLDHPLGPFMYTISCMHCMTVSLAQGGEGLGAMWGVEKAQELLTEQASARSSSHGSTTTPRTCMSSRVRNQASGAEGAGHDLDEAGGGRGAARPLGRQSPAERVTEQRGMSQLLGILATAYGVFAALAALLQARQMLTRRASCDVSARFFAAYAGGYAIWLLYGLSVSNVPLIVVDSVGLLCGGVTLAVALSLRGSLLRPASWASCDQA